MPHARPHTPPLVLLAALALFTTLLPLACTSERPCLEREECFAGEFCDRGVCRPYTGTVTNGPRRGEDLPTLKLPDMTSPFDPRDMRDAPDGGDALDMGREDVTDM